MGGRRFHGRTYGPDVLTAPGWRRPVIDPDLGKFGQYGYRSWVFAVCDNTAAIPAPETIPCEKCDAPPGVRCWHLKDSPRSPFRRHAVRPHPRRVFWANATRWRHVRWPAYVPPQCPSMYGGWRCEGAIDHVWRRKKHRAGSEAFGAVWGIDAGTRREAHGDRLRRLG
jgi:hypothetical protein